MAEGSKFVDEAVESVDSPLVKLHDLMSLIRAVEQ